MPRFSNDDYDSQQRAINDMRDRSVPLDENYYAGNDVYSGSSHVDLSAFDKNRTGYVDPSDYNDVLKYDAGIERNSSRKTGGAKHKKSGKSGRKLSKGMAVLVAVLLVLAIAFGSLFAMANGVLGKINYDDKRDNSYVSPSELYRSDDVKNILLLGVDARNPDNASKSRSDSMMILSVDKKHNCIKMVSFLRDSWVYIPARDGKQRLNAACSTDGYHGVADTIEYNFGVKIDGYVVADFEMFKVLVDSVGGVEIEISEKEAKEVTNHKRRYGNVVLEEGTHKLTGEQALAYCRIRKIDTDFMRAYRQRIVINSILKNIKSKGLTNLYPMAKDCAPYIETDLSKSELISVATAALPCITNDMPETRVPFDGTWSYAKINGASVITLDTDKNKELLIDYIYNKSADEIKAEEQEKENKK